MKKVVISKSSKSGKKLQAVFTRENGRTKTVHFGSAGMDDYTKTKDKKQRSRYLQRHRANENWNAPETAGALSRHILWGNSTSRRANITAFKKRFGYS
jgi:ferric iron reductase protein FhuF|tara:strand:+ start:147 stop:440 length:294 start_codon:yes stop_codon:yes gene_type:complete